MQNLVTLAAMTGGTNNLQVSPNSEYSEELITLTSFHFSFPAAMYKKYTSNILKITAK